MEKGKEGERGGREEKMVGRGKGSVGSGLHKTYFSSSWTSAHARSPEVFEDYPSPTQVLTRSS